MKLKKFGFLRHNRKITIEGTNLPGIINKCIKNGVVMKELRWNDELKSTARLKDSDYDKLKKLAGHSYRMSTVKEGGMIPLINHLKTNTLTIIGAFLVGALIFYQGLFVAEIRVDGYSTIAESELRQTMSQAGIYEGAKKPDNYDHIKAALYENHPEITWVSIYEEGRLLKVNIAEAGEGKAAEKEEKTPTNIVAARSGMVEKIIPLQGNARVHKGDYVNKGDVLISGKYKYQSSDYSKGDGFYYMYSHAKGQVLAEVPRVVTFYIQKAQHSKKFTGKVIPGICIKLGCREIDTTKVFNEFKISVRKENVVINLVRPLPIKVSFISIHEADSDKETIDHKKKQAMVEAAIRQYARENLKRDEKIVEYSIDYSETKSIIKAEVFMEVLEDIGIEEKIKINKHKKEEKDT